MKKLAVLTVATLFATSAMAGEMKWSGSAGWQYTKQKYDDSLGSTATVAAVAGKAQDRNGKNLSEQTQTNQKIRANLGVAGGWESVEWGIGLRTQNTNAGSGVDEWVNYGGATNPDTAIGLDLGWFRYMHELGGVNASATVGKQKAAFVFDDNSENFFTSATRLIGLGWNFKMGMFGLNAAQYWLGARSGGTNGTTSVTKTEFSDAAASTQGNFHSLLAFQPYMNWKFSDDIETMFAVGFYKWNTSQFTNLSGGGYASSTINSTTAVNTATTNGSGTDTASKPAAVGYNLKMHDPSQFQIYNTWTLPYSLMFSWEWVQNKKVKLDQNSGLLGTLTPVDVSRNAWAANLNYGNLKKAHDFTAGVTYGKKGIGSVIGAFGNTTILPDNKYLIAKLGYALADNLNLSFMHVWQTENEGIDVSTGKPYAGNFANQKQKSKYWEITTGVSF